MHLAHHLSISRIRNRQLALRPLPTVQVPSKHAQIVAPCLVKNIQARAAGLIFHRRDTHVRTLQSRYGAPRTADREHVFLHTRRLLSVPVDVVAYDCSVGHLRVEVLCEAEGAARMDVRYSVACCVCPSVDRMLVGSFSTAVGILPPDCRCVLSVHHHGVCRGAWEPAVAANAGVRVHVPPCVFLEPLVLPFVPAILLEYSIGTWVPQVHTGCTGVESNRVVVAVAGRELGGIGVTVVVTVPAGLKPNIGGVVHREVELVQRTVLPNVGTVTVYFLFDATVFGDIEDVPLDG